MVTLNLSPLLRQDGGAVGIDKTSSKNSVKYFFRAVL